VEAQRERSHEAPKFKHVLQANRELVQASMTEVQQQLFKRPWSSRTDDDSEEECPAKEATPELSIVRKEVSPIERQTENPKKCWTGFENQLMAIRRLASKNSNISQKEIDGLQHVYERELAGERKAHRKEIRAMKKAFQKKILALRAVYESTISTFIKGSLGGMEALQVARRDVWKLLNNDETKNEEE
jgi:hypothetical protein